MDELEVEIPSLLETMQADMLRRARRERDDSISIVTSWQEFLAALDKGNLVLAPWCELRETEEWVKKESGVSL